MENKIHRYPKEPEARVDSILSWYHRKGQFNGNALVTYQGNILLQRSYDSKGELKKSFCLNPPLYQGGEILITGSNFGCGSSREHAPWSLKDFGIKALIGTSFGDIFKSNCFKNQILAISLTEEQIKLLLKKNKEEITVNVEKQLILCSDLEFNFHLDPFAKYCLLQGVDETSFIQRQIPKIESFEKRNSENFLSVVDLL